MSEFLTTGEVAAMLNRCERTIHNYRKAGILPKVYHFPTESSIVWKKKDIEKFIEDAD